MEKIRTPSLVNWITTLNGLEHLSKNLKKKFSINFFVPREVNQDALENFFGQMRQHRGWNINPNAYDYIWII